MAAVVQSQDEQPISRTFQYRKVMKPMLERKRRARINRCLDELKELLVGALQAEGESVSRLEKADVLELTVRHLHKLRRAQQLSESSAGDRFRAGFSHCANEVSKYMSGLTSSIDLSVSSRLVTHLDHCIHSIETQQCQLSPSAQPGYPSPNGLNVLTNYTPPSSPISSPANPTMNPKLFAYMASAEHRLHSPSPAHLQSPFGIHAHPHHLTSLSSAPSQQPLSLCTKSPDEPFDLSNGCVWRPW